MVNLSLNKATANNCCFATNGSVVFISLVDFKNFCIRKHNVYKGVAN